MRKQGVLAIAAQQAHGVPGPPRTLRCRGTRRARTAGHRHAVLACAQQQWWRADTSYFFAAVFLTAVFFGTAFFAVGFFAAVCM